MNHSKDSGFRFVEEWQYTSFQYFDYIIDWTRINTLTQRSDFENDYSIQVDVFIYSSPNRNVTNMEIRGQRGQMGCCTFGKGSFKGRYL